MFMSVYWPQNASRHTLVFALSAKLCQLVPAHLLLTFVTTQCQFYKHTCTRKCTCMHIYTSAVKLKCLTGRGHLAWTQFRAHCWQQEASWANWVSPLFQIWRQHAITQQDWDNEALWQNTWKDYYYLWKNYIAVTTKDRLEVPDLGITLNLSGSRCIGACFTVENNPFSYNFPTHMWLSDKFIHVSCCRCSQILAYTTYVTHP